MFTSNTWGRIAGIIAGVPVLITSERCVDIWKRWYHKLIDKILLRFTYKVIGNSNAVKKFYQETEGIPANKITVIYNGIDLEEFQNIEPCTIEIEKKGGIVGTGGRFTEQKGLIYLLMAIPEVLKMFPDTKFIFVGDGPLRRSFEDFVKSHKISDSVIFTGYRKDILSIFSLCDVIVVPSLFEGMSNIILEAMALKKPVIGTNIPEIAELIEDGKNGFLVSLQDIKDEIVKKIIFLFKNPDLCKNMGENGYKIIQERFSVSAMVNKYEECYSEVLSCNFIKGQF